MLEYFNFFIEMKRLKLKIIIAWFFLALSDEKQTERRVI